MTPNVEILLATYKPDLRFLKIQLESLNQQDYPNLFLSVRDDSADFNSFTLIKEMLETTITRIPYSLQCNETNIGSSRTFMKLTEDSSGDWLAYCDQDDDWIVTKISRLIAIAEKEKAVLIYSDLSIIDQNGIQIHTSFKSMNPRLKHVYGENKFSFFLRRNSVTGCTMLVSKEIARQALPFEIDHYVHDHWLALYASSKGRIAYSPEPLVRYRIHGNNQIGNSILRGILNTHDYVEIRLKKEIDMYRSLLLKNRFGMRENLIIEHKLQWATKRDKFMRTRKLSTLIAEVSALRDDPQLVFFEMVLALAPKHVSETILRRMQK